MSDFILPSGNVQFALSGGRTSAYLLYQALQANGKLPTRCRVVFTNTGRERPETIAFVKEISRRWSVPIDIVEYRAGKPFFEVVGENSISMNGEPFDALIDKKQYLPNSLQRFCTIELKILTAKRFLVSLGWTRWTAAVGFRSDEPHRLGKPDCDNRYTNWTPLADAGVTKWDVQKFWADQDFDLNLPVVNGNTVGGNCDGCFLKSEAALSALARDEPDRHVWWEDAEKRIGARSFSKGKSASDAVFSRRYTREQLRSYVDRQGDWIFTTEGALCQRDDGECAA